LLQAESQDLLLLLVVFDGYAAAAAAGCGAGAYESGSFGTPTDLPTLLGKVRACRGILDSTSCISKQNGQSAEKRAGLPHCVQIMA
jgi:hypothetical protein